jgi:hypothetical protein
MVGAPGAVPSMGRSDRIARAKLKRLLPSWPSLAFVLLGGSVLVACPIDDRAIKWGGEGGANLGGAAGALSEIDADWSFDNDVEGWQVELGAEQDFDEQDALGNPESGSLRVTNTSVKKSSSKSVTAGSTLCVSVDGGSKYVLGYDSFMPKDRGLSSTDFAVEYFSAENCAGLMLEITDWPSSVVDRWQRTTKTGAAPDTAKSALLELVVTKIYKDPALEVRFDNVRFSRQ